MDDPQFRTADGSAIRIWTDTAKNPFASEQQGRPIFDEAIYVEVIAPGSKGSSPVFEVERIYHESVGHPPYRSPQYATYEEQIKAYKDKSTVAGITGTPLTEWPEVSRSMAASLKASEIFTVEALAALPDGRLKSVGPDGRVWRTKAQAWLDSTKDAGHATALAAALEQANAREDDFKRQIAELSAKLEASEASPAPVEAPPAPAKPARGSLSSAPPAAPPAPLAPAPEGGDNIPAAPTLGNLV